MAATSTLIDFNHYKNGFTVVELYIGVVVAKSHSQHVLQALTGHKR